MAAWGRYRIKLTERGYSYWLTRDYDGDGLTIAPEKAKMFRTWEKVCKAHTRVQALVHTFKPGVDIEIEVLP